MNINTELFLYLLILFQIKHFFADFVFQNVWMLQKSRPGWDFVPPLAIHCGIHSISTLAFALYLNPSLWWLAAADFVIHFITDRIKAGPRYLGRFHDIRGKAFWVTFGIDQMIHHLTHIWICYLLASV